MIRNEFTKCIHFSKRSDIEFLDKTMHGEGIKCAEYKRAVEYPEVYLNERVYLYDFKLLISGDINRDYSLGIYAYITKIPTTTIYDLDRDPERYIKHSKEICAEYLHGTNDHRLATCLMEVHISNQGYAAYRKSGTIVSFNNLTAQRNLEYDNFKL